MRAHIFVAVGLVALPTVPQAAQAASRASCRGQPATIVGTSGRDVIETTDERDVIVTKGGDDSVTGVGGRDLVCAGPGDDRISNSDPRGYEYRVFAGRGDDRVRVGAGTIFGEGGSDVLHSGGGVAFGGRGADDVTAEYGSAYGGPGDDRLTAAGRIDGGAGDDILTATPDCTPLMAPGAGNDVMTGDSGSCLDDDWSDTYMELLGAPRGVRVNVEKGLLRGWGTDRFTNVRYFTASRHDDVLIGTQARDWLTGAGGADVLIGRGGDDYLAGDDFYAPGEAGRGRPGSDVIRGGEGDDSLHGREGADQILGGAGNDAVSGGVGADELDGGAGESDLLSFENDAVDVVRPVEVDLAEGRASGRGADVLAGFESVEGSSFDDVLIGDTHANTFYPDFGDDVVRGGAGDDVIIDSIDGYWPPSGDDRYDGEEGIDTVSWIGAWDAITADLTTGVATGNGSEILSGIEILIGSRYADQLFGDDAANQLFGLGGSDELDARLGIDHINGGTDADVCVNGETLEECP